MNPNETPLEVTPQDLMAIGLNDIAYVRPGHVEGENVFTVHAADGTQIAVFADREIAFAAVRRHDMEPLSVH